MANIATLWYVLFYPSIRRRCRFYLDRRFPHRQRRLQKFLDTYRLVRTYSATLVDPVVLDILGRGAFDVGSPDHERLLQISTKYGGMVLIHAHVGCWQVAMSTLGELPKKISVVRIPEPTMPSTLDESSIGSIDPRNGLHSAMEMASALLDGEILVMAGDRTLGTEQTHAPARFLGGQIFLPITPYRLASATGAPVLAMNAPNLGGNRFELRLAKVIEVPPNLGRNPEAYAPYAQMFADCLEQFVQDFPWQFYNFYDFWQNVRTPE
jgi:predicted LPLAT superfamily acyltransferase